MGAGNYQFEQVVALLPEGWEAKARELGAFERPREVKSPEELLRLIFLYLTEGKSFAGTSALARLGGELRLNKIAVYKRIRNSGEWLQWLCEHLCRGNGLLTEKPAWLEGKQVCLVDGSEVVTAGSAKQYYRLDYCLDLFTLGMRELHLRDMKTGERLSNFASFGAGDIVAGDRIYGTLPGMRYLRERGSGYVLRLRGKAFTVYGEEGVRVDLLEQFRGLGEGESGSVVVYVRTAGALEPLRVCALRKDQESERAGLKRLQKENQRKRGGKAVSSGQREWNQYIVVATSLGEEVPASLVLELYRARWQIELAFKRLKSLFGYGQVPSKAADSVRAWFYGKLLEAMVCETLVNTGRFSPRRGGGSKRSADGV